MNVSVTFDKGVRPALIVILGALEENDSKYYSPFLLASLSSCKYVNVLIFIVHSTSMLYALTRSGTFLYFETEFMNMR